MTGSDSSIVQTPQKRVRILGIRGVPGQHGGFETFADHFSRHLVKHGWEVVVYCQEEGSGPSYESVWQGVKRIHIPVTQSGPLGTIIFDLKSAFRASREKGLILTLGYNTAFCSILFRIMRLTNLMNMDGIEWKRGKWSKPVQLWFRLNELLGCFLANHLIADHPEIKAHLARTVRPGKITVAAYGSERIPDADPAPLASLGLTPGKFCTIIARPEPENSILPMVSAFSRRKRGYKLVVLGKYRDDIAYHQAISSAASEEVVFPGAIYDTKALHALRFHNALYLHGHTVGGTNPSLIEALGAGSPVLAHDNQFNRWVTGNDAARFFRDEDSCAHALDELLAPDAENLLKSMRKAAWARHHEAFEWENILDEHEKILLKALK